MKIKKRYVFLTIIAVFITIILISILSWFIYKKSIKSLLNNSVDSFAVLNFDNYSKNKNVQFLAEEIGALLGSDVGSAVTEANKYIKFLNNIFILHLNEDLSSVESVTGSALIAGIDAGALYIPAFTQLHVAFDRLPDKSGIYKLNAKLKKELGLPKDINIYVKPYKGLFLAALSDKYLKTYTANYSKSKKNPILSKDYSRSKEELAFFGGNFEKTFNSVIPENVFITKITNISGVFSFDPYFGKIVLKLNVEGDGDLFAHLASSAIPDRPLFKYIKPGSYYIANNNFTKFISYISSGFVKMQDVDYIMALKTLLGFDIIDIIKLCGNEIIIGNTGEEYYALASIKEKLMLQSVLGSIASQSGDTYTFMDKNIYLKDDKIFFNNYWAPYDNDIFITKETFFFSKIPISMLNGISEFENSFLEIDARYDPSYNVMLYLKLSKEDLKRLLIN